MKTYTCCKCGGDIYPGQKYKLSGKDKYHFKPDCGHAQSVHATEPAPRPAKNAKFEKPFSPTTRLLESKILVSEKERVCDYCCDCDSCHLKEANLILPGTSYVREVWRTVPYPGERKVVIVVKYRHDPQCPIDRHDPEADSKLAEVVVMKKRPRSKKTRFRRAA
jgi:hypothetical protein